MANPVGQGGGTRPLGVGSVLETAIGSASCSTGSAADPSLEKIHRAATEALLKTLADAKADSEQLRPAVEALGALVDDELLPQDMKEPVCGVLIRKIRDARDLEPRDLLNIGMMFLSIYQNVSLDEKEKAATLDRIYIRCGNSPSRCLRLLQISHSDVPATSVAFVFDALGRLASRGDNYEKKEALRTLLEIARRHVGISELDDGDRLAIMDGLIVVAEKSTKEEEKDAAKKLLRMVLTEPTPSSTSRPFACASTSNI
jgi:hypothetical protein